MSGGLPPSDPYYGGAPPMPGYPPMMGPKVGSDYICKYVLQVFTLHLRMYSFRR